MKLLTIILMLLLSTVASAQDMKGWFVGASADVFWDQPAENMFTKPRVQLSKVLQIGHDPNIFSLPGLSWRSSVGEVNFELLNIYHQLHQHNDWKFFVGAGAAPLILKTEERGAVAEKASIGIDLAVAYMPAEKFGMAAGLKMDWQAAYTKDSPDNKDVGTTLTFTLGIISDFLGF